VTITRGKKVARSCPRKHQLTIYDAAYLELAIRSSASLATLDSALEAAAIAEGVEVVA
jgi:predicted nucleic acid-binding protein